MIKEEILKIEELEISFSTGKKDIKTVDGVSLSLKKGETIGVVGESGSGKSVTALSILRLLDKGGKIVNGQIYFKGNNLTKIDMREMRSIRGNEISMIFQEPMTSLNPVYTIGQQIRETIKAHKTPNKVNSNERGIELLKLVGIPSPKERMNQYPHELSGGMRQRVMIAMALACNPELLIADEPTTALDVTIQAQILDLINKLQNELGMSVFMITHDLGVVAETCDQVAVMYGGQVVEFQDVYSLFDEPKHPYTIGLLNSIPRYDIDVDELEPIKGSVPNADEMPKGCRFAPRCEFATELCHQKLPRLERLNSGNVRCWIYSDEWDGDPEVNIYERK